MELPRTEAQRHVGLSDIPAQSDTPSCSLEVMVKSIQYQKQLLTWPCGAGPSTWSIVHGVHASTVFPPVIVSTGTDCQANVTSVLLLVGSLDAHPLKGAHDS